jgi:hypothetical protein
MQPYLELSAFQLSHEESFTIIICPMRSTFNSLCPFLLLVAPTSMGKSGYCEHVQVSSSQCKKDKGPLEYIARLKYFWKGIKIMKINFMTTKLRSDWIWRLPAVFISYLLTPWSRVLLEKLTGLQPVKKFPAFYGTQMFINAFTNASHLSLSWASLIQSIPHIPLH